jgi:predicted permease
MISELFAVIAPILVCAGLGYGWARRGIDYPVDFVTRLVMNVGAPCLILASFNQADIDIGKMTEITFASLVILGMMAVIGVLLIRFMRLEIGTFLPSLLFSNIGNMGLPLCLFAFGETGLALGLTIFLLIFSLQLTLGITLVAGRANLKGLIKQPVLWATAIALILVAMDWSLPTWIDNTTSILGGFTIPLMLVTLGVSLAQLKVAEWKHSLLFSAIRVLGGFVLALLVANWFGLQGVERGVLILQFSMPVAVFNYLLALKFDRDPGEVAGMVVLSTLLAFVCLPFIVAYVLI